MCPYLPDRPTFATSTSRQIERGAISALIKHTPSASFTEGNSISSSSSPSPLFELEENEARPGRNYLSQRFSGKKRGPKFVTQTLTHSSVPNWKGNVSVCAQNPKGPKGTHRAGDGILGFTLSCINKQALRSYFPFRFLDVGTQTAPVNDHCVNGFSTLGFCWGEVLAH